MRRLWRGIRALLAPEAVDRDIADETAHFLEQATAEQHRVGRSSTEASRAARLEFGPMTQVREQIRGSGWEAAVDHAVRDLRFALRRLRRTPWVTGIVIATLAVVIAANTTMFGLIDAIFLRRLPVPRAAELAQVQPLSGGGMMVITNHEYRALVRDTIIPPTAAYLFDGMRVVTPAGSELLWGDAVSGNYFNLLAVRPMLGRLLTPADDETAAPVVVFSVALWHRMLGSDSAAIGKNVLINGHQFTLVGVIDSSFDGLYFAHHQELAIPLGSGPSAGLLSFSSHYLDLITRVPGSRRDAADQYQRALQACCQGLPAEDPSGFSEASQEHREYPGDAPTGDGKYTSRDRSFHVTVADASRGLTWSINFRSEYRGVLFRLLAGVVLLTLIACANIATLMLARAAVRRRQLAVCASLGATRGRLMRGLLMESAMLGAAGALLGLILAGGATRFLLHELPSTALRLKEVAAWRIDPIVFSFTAVVTLACTIVSGLWPARLATRIDLHDAFKGDRPASLGRRAWIADDLLVVVQLSLTFVLVTSATLFVSTLRNLGQDRGGYGQTNVLLTSITTGDLMADAPSIRGYTADILRGSRALPGVLDATLAEYAPAFNRGESGARFLVPGASPADGRGIELSTNAIDGAFFRVLGTPVLEGRSFTDADGPGSDSVIIVSQSLAHRYFPAGAIGQQISRHGKGAGALRIVGVAPDLRFGNLRDAPVDMVYTPMRQASDWTKYAALIVRVSGEPSHYARPVARLVAAVAPNLRTDHTTSLSVFLDDILGRERIIAALATLFGSVALALSAIGLYGLLAYRTARRTAEIGVRMALGATALDATALVLRQALRLAVGGVALGIPLALMAGNVVRAELYGVGGASVAVLGGCGAIMVFVGCVACIAPARRAARVDPMVALRVD